MKHKHAELIKELAEQAGLQPYYKDQKRQIERFAELIRQDETKACAEHYLEIMRDAVEQAVTELRRLREVNQELLKSALLFQDYMKFMDAGDDVKGMLAFAELVEVNAAAIAKAEGDEK